jgi:hypothetical protein
MKKMSVAVLLTLVAVGPAYSQYGKPKPQPQPSCSYWNPCKPPVKTPEPSSIALVATGLLVAGGMVLLGRKRLVSE